MNAFMNPGRIPKVVSFREPYSACFFPAKSLGN
jgi:hypothetical protein